MLACHNTLRVTHGGLAGDADTHNNQYPQIGPDATADSFAAVLVSSGQVPQDFRPVCPACLPADPVTPAPAAGYTYTLGYRGPNGDLVGLRRPSTTSDEHDLLPISADYPSANATPPSPVHSARMLQESTCSSRAGTSASRPHRSSVPTATTSSRMSLAMWVLARLRGCRPGIDRETGHNGWENPVEVPLQGSPGSMVLRSHILSLTREDSESSRIVTAEKIDLFWSYLSRILDTRVRIGHITGVLRNPLPHQIGTLSRIGGRVRDAI